jgi:hypothetical protein
VPDNVLNVGSAVFTIVVWTTVLLAIALSFSFKYRAASDKAGASGNRPPERSSEGEIVRPDGFIDSFAGVISEAGGGVPFMATLIMLAMFVVWLAYLIMNWKG